jgi:dipeptidyl aminopeptidase/acylaminoacyl peptidase
MPNLRHLCSSLALGLALGAAACGGPQRAPDPTPTPTNTATTSGTGGQEQAQSPQAIEAVELVPIAESTPHAFSIRDMQAMERLSGPVLSPDGTRIAYELRQTDLRNNRGRMDIWLVALADGVPRRLTTHPDTDSSPAWAPDGSAVYFLSTRSGSSQVWKQPIEGGEAVQVTSLPLDVGTFQLAPTGSHLAVTMDVFVDCDTLACTVERAEARKQNPATGVVYDRLFVRHWDTWKDNRRSHLFAVPLAGTGEPVDLTAGMDADVPGKPFGGAEDYAFHPGGDTIVFTARDVGREEPWSTDFDLYTVPVDGSARPRILTDGNPAWDAHPVFSPDGSTLVYAAMQRPGYESDRFRLMVRDWQSGKTRTLAEGWDRSANDVVFTSDGRTLLVTSWDIGRHSLFAIDVAGGQVERLVQGGYVGAPMHAGERIAFLRDDLRTPAEIWTAGMDGSQAAPLTHHNDARLAAAQMGETEQFSFKGAGGDRVYGWITKPANFDPGQRYPVAFLIHGGPQGSFGDHFHYRWNPQAYAGAGYAVIMIDFHGSVGYGQAFTDAIRADWGGKPLTDLKNGLAAALKDRPWMDGERACALGASYGGFMINWIAGNWSDRFRCLVNHDGTFDSRMMYYATEELWFPEWEQNGGYFANPKAYEKHNPLHHVSKWKTPMLVIHGGLDFRVPLEQGLATFTALQRRGIPSKFLYFPDENHWVLRTANSIQWHQEVLSWLDAHTKP